MAQQMVDNYKLDLHLQPLESIAVCNKLKFE